MRMLVMFDIPTETHEDKKAYRQFRKFLIAEGFIMHQYSVYSKLLLNGTAKNAMMMRLEQQNPQKGLITVLTVTEKQFSRMVYLSGKRSTAMNQTDQRLIVLGDEEND